MVDFCLNEIGLDKDVINTITGETPMMVACSDTSTIFIAIYLLEKNASPDWQGRRVEDTLPDCDEKDAFVILLKKIRKKKIYEQRQKVINTAFRLSAAAVCVGLWSSMAGEIPSTAMDPGFFWQG
jgi:hypothetical protein